MFHKQPEGYDVIFKYQGMGTKRPKRMDGCGIRTRMNRLVSKDEKVYSSLNDLKIATDNKMMSIFSNKGIE